ncbi:hypothetical protein SBA4_4930004 [Candidatus Sulfopaludibacter sp. SbA4]|nr:hypothetical protein SBA4_4930004 [Candidatus Sulfopaludibacter sp. SbA4]
MPYSVIPVEGVGGNPHRGIAFLQCEEEQRIDAKKVFDNLKEKNKRDLLSRFDYWLGGQTSDKYFHGWPNLEEYKACFVFKWKQAGAQRRLYGFLCHPRAVDRAFQACVLVLHSQKHDETDFSELDYINRVRTLPAVVRAAKELFG